MPGVPSILLKGLYVKGSLKRTGDGFEFQIKNDIMSGSMVKGLPLKLDHKPIPMEKCSFVHGGREVTFTQVSADQPVLMRKGDAVTVRVQGEPLRPGRHSLEINAVAQDVGTISFSVSDEVR
jgi:hydroxymethylglutaryl-CoA reductase (NADPH)